MGAASTGVQLAEEIHRSGRPVILAVGGHVRMPRVYRGMDIMWWLDAAGVLDERYDEVDDIVRARHVSSFQLVGSPARLTVDLNSLQQIGVRLVGRFAGVTEDGTAQFSGSLPNQCALADLKLGRLLDTLDDWAIEHGFDSETDPPERFPPTNVPPAPPLLLSLRTGDDQDDHLGDRLSAGVSLAAHSGPRRQRRGSPRRWRHPCAGSLRDGDHLPAPAEVDPDRRRRRRRSRPQHPPLRVLGSAGEGHMTSASRPTKAVMRSR